MEDQATKLRRLVEGKSPNSDSQQETNEKQTRTSGHVYRQTAAETNKTRKIIRSSEILTDGQQEQFTAAASLGIQAAPHMAKTIAITSGKGGVGKTSLTVNLAIALGQMGKRVIIVDADLGMANVDILLGTSSRYSLIDLIDDGVDLKDVIIRGPYGVSYISGGSGMEHVGDFTPLQKKILFDKLASCDEWADIILVDTGAGIGNNVLDFIISADEVVLLTTPEPTALTDAYALMKAYSRLSGKQSLKLVVNRVYDEPESKEVMTKLSRTGDKFLGMQVDCLGYVLDDRNMVGAIRKQIPLMASYPNTMAAKCIQSIARGILSGHQEKVQLGWHGFLQKFFSIKG